MALLQVLAVLTPILVQGVSRQGLRSTKLSVARTELASYTFSQYMQEFGLHYASSSEEYSHRAGLFQQSVQRIQALNAREGMSWKAGIHAFMDWTPAERRSLNGYKSSRNQHGARQMAGLQIGTSGKAHSRLNTSFEGEFGDSVIGEGAKHRNQGNCGSCWAISAAEAIEAQLRRSGNDVSVSAQAFVDCVPNPQHCGGSGGCDGATGELAYAFMQKYGIPLEADLPYTAKTGTCRMDSTAAAYPTKRRATVSGWESLPSNSGKALKQALVDQGSAVVAVDGNDWFDYSAGVFDGCTKDADIGHAVLAKGYGTDASSGKNFWLIQNSWGTNWGENGDIRLLRHESDDDFCGTDSKPQDGVGCDGGPPTQHVCGMCGLLFDPVVPKDVRIVNDAEEGSSKRASEGDYTPWRPALAL